MKKLGYEKREIQDHNKKRRYVARFATTEKTTVIEREMIKAWWFHGYVTDFGGLKKKGFGAWPWPQVLVIRCYAS